MMTCDVCGRERECQVAASPTFPTSFSYCEECIKEGAWTVMDVRTLLGRHMGDLEGYENLDEILDIKIYIPEVGYMRTSNLFKKEEIEELSKDFDWGDSTWIKMFAERLIKVQEDGKAVIEWIEKVDVLDLKILLKCVEPFEDTLKQTEFLIRIANEALQEKEKKEQEE